MANEIVNRQVNIFIETGNAQKAYDKLIEKEKRLKEELVKATDPGTVKRLTAELNKLSEPIDRARKKINGELKPSIKEMEQLVKGLANQLRLADDPAAFNRLKVQLNGAKLELQKLRTEAGF
jgi:recombinational DNA repair ATPase RecF